MFGLNEALMSFIRRQVGLRTDAASATGSLHAKTTKIVNDLTALVSDVSNGVYLTMATASDTIKISSDSETFNGNPRTTYTLIKSIGVGLAGKMRIKFSLRNIQSGRTAYAQIYRNGQPYGTERSTTSTTYVEFIEDLYFGVGDTIEIWGKCSHDLTIMIANFRVCFDYASFYPGVVVKE